MKANRITDMGQGSHIFVLIDNEKYKIIRQQKTGVFLLSKCESPYSNMFSLSVEGESIIVTDRITAKKEMTLKIALKEIHETTREDIRNKD